VERTLDAPNLLDDYYFSLMDWHNSNLLYIALGDMMYLWYASTGSTFERVTAEEDNGRTTSVSWAPDCRHLAIGLNSFDIRVHDTSSNTWLVKHCPT
jgi:cell division cycle protein 20 (cofactor of APC complex)